MDRTLKILLAEDNPDDVFFFKDAYRKAGGTGEVYTVWDGVEAVAYLSAEGIFADRMQYPFPDVLLLDLNMPRMNGFEVLEWVRQNPKACGLMVHVLTSSVREADVERAYASHANGYVVKPSRVTELAGFVSALLHWHRFLSFAKQPEITKVEASQLTSLAS